jgi:hypothetical protein
MKRTYFLPIFLFAIISTYTNAQFSQIGNLDLIVKTNELLDDSINLSETEGTPYENETFVFGRAISEKMDISSPYLMRYNIYNDVIEVEDKDQINSLKKSLDLYAVISNKEYHYKEYADESERINKGYFILLYSGGNIELFLRKTQKHKEPKPPKNSFQPKEPGAFIDYENYFIKTDGILFEMSTNKKEVTKQFPGIEADIKNFMKANKTSLKSKEDVIELMTFVDAQLK